MISNRPLSVWRLDMEEFSTSLLKPTLLDKEDPLSFRDLSVLMRLFNADCVCVCVCVRGGEKEKEREEEEGRERNYLGR